MTDPTPPRPVRLVVIGIYVLAVWNLVGVVEVAASRTVALGVAEVSAVLLVAMALLLVWLGAKTWGGRGWARNTVSVLVALGLLNGLPSWPGTELGQMLRLVNLAVHVTVLVLLWAPASARAYFSRANSE